MKICEKCGRSIETVEEFEKRVGQPIVYLLRQYEEWKRLKQKEEPGRKAIVGSDVNEGARVCSISGK